MTEDVTRLIAEGIEHLALGYPRAALFVFQEAISLSPQFAEPHCCAGTAYLRLGQSEEALREFQEAVLLDPNNAEAYSGMASALRRRGDHAAQATLLEHASRLPAIAWQHDMILGDLAESHKDYNTALRHYQNARDRESHVRGLDGCIGYVLLKLRRYAEAREVLVRAVKDDLTDSAFYNLGLCEQKLHHRAEAYHAFQSAIAVNPEHIKSYAQLSRFDLRAGRLRSALTYFVKGVKLEHGRTGKIIRAGWSTVKAWKPLWREWLTSFGKASQVDSLLCVRRRRDRGWRRWCCPSHYASARWPRAACAS